MAPPNADYAGTLTITAERVGRRHYLAPLTVECSDDLDAIAEAVYRYARPHLASRDVEVVADEDGTWTVFAGFRVGGNGQWALAHNGSSGAPE